MVRIGVLGGTFDPVHYGHLRLAEETMEAFDLQRILFMPSGNPPHKDGAVVTDAGDRLEMLKLATDGHPRFDVSRIELDRQGPSYTVDTLVRLREEYGTRAEIYFILGADAVLELHTWKEPERVLALCRLVAAARPGFDLERLRSVPVPGLSDRLSFVPGPRMDLSSTQIRERVRERRSIRFLTPEAVRVFILKRGLYSGALEREE